MWPLSGFPKPYAYSMAPDTVPELIPDLAARSKKAAETSNAQTCNTTENQPAKNTILLFHVRFCCNLLILNHEHNLDQKVMNEKKIFWLFIQSIYHIIEVQYVKCNDHCKSLWILQFGFIGKHFRNEFSTLYQGRPQDFTQRGASIFLEQNFFKNYSYKSQEKRYKTHIVPSFVVNF